MHTPNIHIDFETRSAVNLKVSGSERYAEDPSTSILCMAYKIDDGEILVWDPLLDPMPKCLTTPYNLIAHNASFELAIIEHKLLWLGAKRPSSVTCTMTAAMQRNLPAALSDVCKALGLPEQKSDTGRKLMLKMCKAGYEHTPEELSDLIAYCVQDVKAECGLHNLISMLESELYALDRKINSRGILADTDLAESILQVVEWEKSKLTVELQELTDGAVQTGNQVAALLAWLRTQGYPYYDLTADSVSRAIENRPVLLTNKGFRALQIRENYALGSIGKYKSILGSVCSDGRVKGLFQMCGAAQTGRWAGRRVQFQNLPRLVYKDHEIELAVDAFKRHDTGMLKFLFGDVFTAAKQLIRPTFIATEGSLIVSDFAAIECRVLAWLVGEEELLSEFRSPTPRVYESVAAKIYRVPRELVTEPQRQIGKAVALGCGYGLGANGFYEQLQRQQIEVSFEDCQEAVTTYRNTYSKTRNFWYRLEDKFKEAILHPGEFSTYDKLTFACFPIGGNRVSVTIRLPSGRKLYFHNCTTKESTFGQQIYFDNAHGVPTPSYGGKLCLGAGTLVLADRGWVAIEDIQPADRVFDGENWVRHEGVIAQGTQEVIFRWGTWMTPDHRVLTTKGWINASQLNEHSRYEVRIPDGYPICREQREEESVGRDLRLREGGDPARRRDNSEERDGDSVLWMHEEDHNRTEEFDAQNVEAPRIRGLEINDRPMQTSYSSSVCELRGSGDSGMCSVGGVRGFLGGYGSDIRIGADVRPNQQRGKLRPRELSLDYVRGSVQQPKGESPTHRGKNDSPDIRGDRNWKEHDSISDRSGLARGVADNETRLYQPTYDILNAGPRRRFVVLGDRPFVSHNCENITQAIARDLLANAMLNLDGAGFEVVAHVHDEVVLDRCWEEHVAAVNHIMSTPPDWANTLPLAAKTHLCNRYSK